MYPGPTTPSVPPQEFRYKVTSLVSGVLRFENGVLLYKQGLRSTVIPIASILRFGFARRGGRGLGMLTSELIILENRGATTPKTRRMPFDLDDPQCQAALALLRQLRPDADTTTLPWIEAAPLLGENPFGWRQVIANPLSLIGFITAGAGIGVSSLQGLLFGDDDESSMLGRAIGGLLAVVVGVVLVVVGILRARKQR